MLMPHSLRTEYAENPLSVDTPRPRLSWQLRAAGHADRRGGRQTAYRVQAATSHGALSTGNADLWDTGKVTTADQMVAYAGPVPLRGEPVWWQVCVWDEEDTTSQYSAPARFERGLPSDEWRADWIGFPVAWPGRALTFRTTFEITRPVHRARCYVTGLGYYELYLNGAKVGDHVLDPGTTGYDRRVLYATYDVTDHLNAPARDVPAEAGEGANVIGAVVGHGWYGAPKLRLELHVTFENGSTTEILTRSGPWQVGPGPILKDSIFGGEVYDARLERPGWSQPAAIEAPEPGGPDVEPTAGWARSVTADPPGGRMVPQTMRPIRVVDTLRPVGCTEIEPGITVYDLGQNFAGWARIHVRGPRGSRVSLRYGESVYRDGTVNQENLRSAIATDVYILAGDDEEVWQPHFTYHGFRYVQVELAPPEATPPTAPSDLPQLLTIEGRFVRSDTSPAGEFNCSRDLLNAIHHMVWWTEASNQHSIPTDCPQRDERMGWLNDLGARAEEAIYNFDMGRFFSKWVADIHDAQDTETGAITDTAPFRWGNRPADPVSVSYLLIPWLLYRYYGDTRTMADHYEGFRGWVDFLSGVAEDHVVGYSYYGDWAPPIQEAVQGSIGTGAVSRGTPGPLMSTGYYYYAAHLLAQMARVLGKADDAASYSRLAAEVADAYHDRFYDPKTGGYGTNNQACNAFSLYLDLVPDELCEGVVENLVRDVVQRHDHHLTTGNLCTKYLLEVLTETDHADVAYRVATQETYPGWGYMVANGATTVWERWEHATGGGMNSHSHPMLASVGAWLYKALVGITIDLDRGDPAFAHVNIRPHVVGDLTSVRGALKTVKGTVVSDWAICDSQPFTLHVVMPIGTEAGVSVPKPPDGTPFTIREGTTTVWDHDRGQVATVDGLCHVFDEETYVTFEVGSGTYTFIREP